MTEATCNISVNPIEGERKIGSVGIPLPYTKIKIIKESANGSLLECKTGESGEICVANPGVVAGNTYTDAEKNKNLYYKKDYFRTGDLGFIDEDGYLFITGRAKDLIIRGGHNIDPALAEEALASHPAVAMAGVIGQPDARVGELPCAYVELIKGSDVSEAELIKHSEENIGEKAAVPKYLELVEEMPKHLEARFLSQNLEKEQ